MPDIAISLIWVKRDSRQRRKLEADPSLQSSIQRVGLINPIIVTKDFQLIAGERRFEACKVLGHQTIAVRWAEDLSSDENKLIELEENIKRKDISWQDQARAISELHSIYSRTQEGWTQAHTASATSLHRAYISNILQVATHLKDQRVAKATSMQEALNFIRRRNERNNESEINDLAIFARSMITSPTPLPGLTPQKSSISIPQTPTPAAWTRPAVESNILQENFLDWAKSYNGNTFNLIHCDFPYGANVFGGAGQFKPEDQEGSYSDEQSDYDRLFDCLLENLHKLLSPSGHIMFWLSAKPEIMDDTIKQFQRHNLETYPFPLIWHKSDNAGIVGDSQRWPRHTYEAAILAYSGRRPLIRTVADSYSGSVDRRIHPSCKPEAMLRHFFTALVDENTRFFDPTCGSGSSIRAAESLGALPENTLGLEIEERFVKSAREATISSRILSEASRHV